MPGILESISGGLGGVANRFTGRGSAGRKPNMSGSRTSRGVSSALEPIDPDNPESQLIPGEIKGGDNYQPTTAETRKLKHWEDRFTQAANTRRYHEGRWFESLAFYNDEQYVAWTQSTAQLRDTRPKNSGRIFSKNNKLRPLANKLHARAIGSKIAVSVSPATGLPSDLAAARQCRGGLAHIDDINDSERADNRAELESLVFAPVWCLSYIDTKKTALVPNGYDPATGQFEDVTELENAGDIVRDYRSSVFIYPDPKAKSFDALTWIIDAEVRPLDWIRKHHPERGKFVKPDAGEGPGGIIESTLAAVNNDMKRVGTETGSRCAVYHRAFELPSDVYPDGQYVCWAGGVLLTDVDEPFPYPELAKEGKLPYSYLPYREGIGTLWGDNAVFVAIEAQRMRNRAETYKANRLRRGDGKWMVPYNAELRPDALKSGEPDEIVPYLPAERGGGKPDWIMMGPLDPTINDITARQDADMGEMMEVSQLSGGGEPPPGVTAAIALQTLLDADQSGAAVFNDLRRSFRQRRAEIETALMRQCYQEPRLLFVQDSVGKSAADKALGDAQGAQSPDAPQGMPQDASDDPSDEPKMQAMAFSDLSKGRLKFRTTVASAKTPAARQQMLLDLYKSGAFTPENIPVTITLLEQLEIEEPDKVVQDLLRALKMQMEVRAASAPPPVPPPPPPPDPLMLIQAQTQGRIAEMQARIQAETESKIALMRAERALPPSVSLTGKLDPAGVVSAEEAAGLDVHGTAAHIAVAQEVAPGMASAYGAPAPMPVESENKEG
jgi:hypothetical protein